MLIEELIEKAYSDGYEYALEEIEQREFASIRQATKYAKRSTKDVLKNGGSFDKIGRRSAQMQRIGYKIPTEKTLDRVASVTTNTTLKAAKKGGLPIEHSRDMIKELSKNNSREMAQRFHELSTQKGFRTRKISEFLQ